MRAGHRHLHRLRAVAFVLIALLHRGERPRGFPRPPCWVAMALLLAAHGAGTASRSYAGLRDDHQRPAADHRACVGFSMAALIAADAQRRAVAAAGRERVLDPAGGSGVWLLRCRLPSWSIRWAPRCSASATRSSSPCRILATLTAVNLVIVAMLPAVRTQGATGFATLALPIAARARASRSSRSALAGQLRPLRWTRWRSLWPRAGCVSDPLATLPCEQTFEGGIDGTDDDDRLRRATLASARATHAHAGRHAGRGQPSYAARRRIAAIARGEPPGRTRARRAYFTAVVRRRVVAAARGARQPHGSWLTAWSRTSCSAGRDAEAIWRRARSGAGATRCRRAARGVPAQAVRLSSARAREQHVAARRSSTQSALVVELAVRSARSPRRPPAPACPRTSRARRRRARLRVSAGKVRGDQCPRPCRASAFASAAPPERSCRSSRASRQSASPAARPRSTASASSQRRRRGRRRAPSSTNGRASARSTPDAAAARARAC